MCATVTYPHAINIQQDQKAQRAAQIVSNDTELFAVTLELRKLKNELKMRQELEHLHFEHRTTTESGVIYAGKPNQLKASWQPYFDLVRVG